MNPEQWERVQRLFHEALERGADQRAAFMDALAREDRVLHDEVASLLRSHDEEGVLDGYEKGRDPEQEQFDRVAGALVDRYTLVSKAGQGGMATVYRARDLKHHRSVAIKVLHPFLAHALGLDRFLAEIETTAGLQHPHILPLFDSGEADGFLFFVMPFVEGESLRERMERERQLPVHDAVRIATRVAEALDYAHRRGVVHRDVKPGNVLLQDGQPAVADFGIALALGAAGEDRLTRPGYGLGTPRYMSPEQVTGDHVVGPASDVYALGCVLYEMLVGEPPFGGQSADSVRRKVVEGPTPSPREIRRSIPPNVDAAIRKSLEKLPADRFKSAKDFALALANPEFRHGDDLAAVGASAARWKSTALLFAGLLVTSLGVTAWALTRSEPPLLVERFIVTPPDEAGMLETYVGVGLALSRDGRRLVYVGAGPQGRQLWQRPLDALEPVPIPWTEGADNPVFSPDGSVVAFREGDNLKTISLLGGLPTVLLEEGVTGQYMDWGDDGFIYFASDSIISRIPGAGGRPEAVTTPFEGARTRLPRVIPGGHGLLVTLRRDAAAQATVGVVGPEGGPIRELLPGLSARYSPSGHLVYATPDGNLAAAPFDPDRLEVTGESTVLIQGLDVRIPGLGAQFALSESGTLVYRTAAVADLHRPVWVDRDGSVTPVAADWTFRADVDDSSLALSPDGERLVVSLPRGIGGGWDLWMRMLDGSEPTRLTTEGIENRRPSWSSDGSVVTYVHSDLDGVEVRSIRVDGTGRGSSVPTGGASGHRPSEAFFSSSGEWLVFRAGSTDLGANPDVYALRVGVDSMPSTLLAERHVEWAPTLSPDDRWLAYSSDETGRSEVYVRPFPDVDAGATRISMGGGDNPIWSPTGRELFYRDGSDRLVSVEITLQPSFAIVSQRALFSAAGFLRGDGHPMYDVTPDGERFVMLEDVSSTGSAELVLIKNWVAELTRRLP